MLQQKKLNILLVGASGTLGKYVLSELASRHNVITAARHHAEINIDITDVNSIKRAFDQVGTVHAVISVAGETHFLPLAEIKAADMAHNAYGLGLSNKLMGQVNLALMARDRLHQGGSITLTSGILGQELIAMGSSATMVNRAIEGFVEASAIEMPRNIRINAVSPSVLHESMRDHDHYFRGFKSVAAADVALAYSRSVEGLQTGKIYRVY